LKWYGAYRLLSHDGHTEHPVLSTQQATRTGVYTPRSSSSPRSAIPDRASAEHAVSGSTPAYKPFTGRVSAIRTPAGQTRATVRAASKRGR
jgi:hypothetical protein